MAGGGLYQHQPQWTGPPVEQSFKHPTPHALGQYFGAAPSFANHYLHGHHPWAPIVSGHKQVKNPSKPMFDKKRDQDWSELLQPRTWKYIIQIMLRSV